MDSNKKDLMIAAVITVTFIVCVYASLVMLSERFKNSEKANMMPPIENVKIIEFDEEIITSSDE